MRWDIKGTHEHRGGNLKLTVDAVTKEDAVRVARRRGILVGSIMPVTPQSIAADIDAMIDGNHDETLDAVILPAPVIDYRSPVTQPQPVQPVQQIIYVQNADKWSPGVAAVLSFLCPGLGQIYKGQILNGLTWLGFVIIGYAMFIIPGLVLHICCVFGAASGNPRRQ